MNRYEKAMSGTSKLLESLQEENDGQVGYFHHVIINLALPFRLYSELLDYGEDVSEFREDFRDNIRALRTYRDLLNQHPKFKKQELQNGFLDINQTPDAKEYVYRARDFLKHDRF